MSKPGSLTWFAVHEMRLAWRDALSMMTAGRRDRERLVVVGVVVFVSFMHVVAFLALGRLGKVGIVPSLQTLIYVTAAALLSGSAMLSQAMESVTRTFYTRSDLELILSSPINAGRLFAVRIGAMALTVSAMSLFLVGPFIDVLAWRGGARWLGAYGAIFAVSLIATAIAVILTVTLFQTIGPKRTRLAAQIAAAVIGGLFVIGLQMAAMFSTGTMSRLAFLQSKAVVAHMPDIHSAFWWPARDALGDLGYLATFLASSAALFLLVTAIYAPRFADCAIAAAGTSQGAIRKSGKDRPFRVTSPSATLRRKEMLLLIRDPWLASQSLMQLLYLLPPTVLLWRSFTFEGGVAVILVPVLIMSAGQLAGGLAWLTVSGEDAPDLVETAPIPKRNLLRAKITAVLECIAIVFAPFVVALAFASPTKALVAAVGIFASSMSSACIQLWFRSQAKRSQFRRRHTSSRIATFSEAFTSIAWAATGTVAAAGSWLAVIVALLALGLLGCVRLFSPARAQSRIAAANNLRFPRTPVAAPS
jgi:ABC-2 type transport system permease protein